MKKLEELKKEILDGKLNKFYVFYGEDYGIRKHYIDKISTYFPNKIKRYDTCDALSNNTIVANLFSTNELALVYNDMDFAKKNKQYITTFIQRLRDYTLILVYEEALPTSTLFKEFSEYITYFPTVQTNIAKEFVDSEISLLNEEKEDLVYDCKNNYNNILLESDKIRNYAQSLNMSVENAFVSLTQKRQLLRELEPFNCNIFMNNILTGNYTQLAYWINIVKKQDIDKFYMSLGSIFSDYLIAYLIKKYGKWDGSNRAYQYKLPWGRAKVIRELDTPDILLDNAYRVADMDFKVKTGQLSRENCIDYFISIVV